MTAKTVVNVDNILKLDDIIREKNEVDVKKTSEGQEPARGENLPGYTKTRLHRAMSDPVSFTNEYQKRAKRNRCVDCLYSYRFCESQHKHTHFSNSKQIAQRIYPDFLTSLPNESGSCGDLKKKMKHRVLEHSYSSCVELSDSKGPSQKSLIEWYGREYGISVDHSCKECTDNP